MLPYIFKMFDLRYFVRISFEPAHVPMSIVKDQVLREEFSRLFCKYFQQLFVHAVDGLQEINMRIYMYVLAVTEANTAADAQAQEAMHNPLPSFSHSQMTSAPLLDERIPPQPLQTSSQSNCNELQSNNAPADASSSSLNGSSGRAPVKSQTLHIPDFSAFALPESNTWIPVVCNTWTEDDRVLRVIPYLGEEKDDDDDDDEVFNFCVNYSILYMLFPNRNTRHHIM